MRVERQTGLSMVETLTALVVLSFASLAALGIYEHMWASFKLSRNAADQQQTVRTAMDKLVLDLQLSGLNVNPDGSDFRTAEQIEAAFDTAVVLGGDFDGSLEPGLAGDAFDVVAVGNDEIVAYVLAKPDGSSTGTLTFNADVQQAPRDGVVETIAIPDVALVQDDPPYNLYRITFNPDVSTFGTSDFFVRELLAEDILSVTFRYLDSGGLQLNATFDPDTTSDDIGGAETPSARITRAGIEGIELELVGLTRDPDRGWVDPGDPDPRTQAHRKYRLTANVSRRNQGLVGIPDLDE